MKELCIIFLLVVAVKVVTSFKSPVHTYSYKMVKYDLSRLASTSQAR
jgi:hypothetical protein